MKVSKHSTVQGSSKSGPKTLEVHIQAGGDWEWGESERDVKVLHQRKKLTAPGNVLTTSGLNKTFHLPQVTLPKYLPFSLQRASKRTQESVTSGK